MPDCLHFGDLLLVRAAMPNICRALNIKRDESKNTLTKILWHILFFPYIYADDPHTCMCLFKEKNIETVKFLILYLINITKRRHNIANNTIQTHS